MTEDNGKSKANNVTGPNGAYVQGAPPPRPRVFHNNDFGSSSFGSNFGSNDFGSNDFGSSFDDDDSKDKPF